MYLKLLHGNYNSKLHKYFKGDIMILLITDVRKYR
jgi:hypothetical protein